MIHIPFYFWCTFTVLLALATVAGISPLLWDAASYVTEISECVANVATCSTLK